MQDLPQHGGVEQGRTADRQAWKQRHASTVSPPTKSSQPVTKDRGRRRCLSFAELSPIFPSSTSLVWFMSEIVREARA
ncbi:hypothetical protein EIK80_00115 [Caulobacter sp. 602-1]|nr:hypothetical protein EIK80_00115 [Caulobacter sp. 602-1]